MRFCTFSIDGQVHFGFELTPDRYCDLREAGVDLHDRGLLEVSTEGLFESRQLKDWFEQGGEALEVASQIKELVLEEGGSQARGVYLRRQTRTLAPISNPGKMIAIGLNYMDHAIEQNVPVPEKPLMFAKFPTALIGPEEPIKIPPISTQVDPEAELCVVMLKRGRNFTIEAAKQAAGFMVGNDVSARDLQFSDKQWVRGKSCDTFAPCGPFVVTGEDVGDPHKLDIQLKVNDRLQQSSNTSNLIFDCYELIRYISESITLEVGDIIFTGTPSGVGVFRDPQIFLEPGDLVEVKIENLGTLRNPVVAG